MISNKKKIGAYYTPDKLADFIVEKVLNSITGISKVIKVLEPSCGEGVFVKSMLEHSKDDFNFELHIIEKNKTELNKARVLLQNSKLKRRFRAYDADFLNKYKDLNTEYNLIIGNPPYIKKNYLYDFQIRECNIIHKKVGLDEVKNIWTAFLIACENLLNNKGILAFVLPAELLQVKFTSEIRNFLVRQFERIEIYTFDQLLFDTHGQDTVLLIGYKKSEEKGVYYTNIKKIEELNTKRIVFKKNDLILNNSIKWTHHYLKSKELNLIHKIRQSMKTIDNYCNTKPGIVTAANNFFIVNSSTLKRYKLEKLAYPIIQRGLLVNGAIEFYKKDFNDLLSSNIPSYLLCFEDKALHNFDPFIKTYLRKGYSSKLNQRYKMTKRNRWYVIPNLVKASDGFFFKRSHLYPKVLKNNAKILTTDSAYNITMNKGSDIKSFIFSFYNSLTLLFSELDGRFYGGGVLELTPSEFQKLPLPYVVINEMEFNNFSAKFKNKVNIKEILDRNDKLILKKFNLTDEEIVTISKLRDKLVEKRLMKSNFVPL